MKCRLERRLTAGADGKRRWERSICAMSARPGRTMCMSREKPAGLAVSAGGWVHQSCRIAPSSLIFFESRSEFESPVSTCSISLYNLILGFTLEIARRGKGVYCMSIDRNTRIYETRITRIGVSRHATAFEAAVALEPSSVRPSARGFRPRARLAAQCSEPSTLMRSGTPTRRAIAPTASWPHKRLRAANAIDVSRPPTLPQPQTLWTTRLLPPLRFQCALSQRLMLLRRCFEQRRLAHDCSRSHPAWLRSSQAEVRRRVFLHCWLAYPSGPIDPDGLVSRNSPFGVNSANQAAAAQAAAAWQIALASCWCSQRASSKPCSSSAASGHAAEFRCRAHGSEPDWPACDDCQHCHSHVWHDA